MNYQNDCPCRLCVPPKRSITCHTECEDYKKFAKDNAAMREERNKKSEMQGMLYEVTRNGYESMHKKKSKALPHKRHK